MRARRIHEGIHSQDKHKCYCLYESGVPEHKLLTCTSGSRLEVWLNRAWIGFSISFEMEKTTGFSLKNQVIGQMTIGSAKAPILCEPHKGTLTY